MSPRSLDRVALDPLIGVRTLAGAANVVMQLAHPSVGRGVLESDVETGQLFRHPLKRTRTTLAYLAVASRGSEEERRRMRTALDAVHARVRSGPSSPVAYDAMDPRLQLWVAACLYVGLRDTSEAFFGPLAAAEADALYADAAPLATTLQVPARMWPADREAFARYWSGELADLDLRDEVRAHLWDVVMLRFLPRPVAVLLGPAHRFLTAGFLPAAFRDAMGLGWDDRRQRRFDRATTLIGGIVRHLPSTLRRFPFGLVLWDARRRLATTRPLL